MPDTIITAVRQPLPKVSPFDILRTRSESEKAAEGIFQAWVSLQRIAEIHGASELGDHAADMVQRLKAMCDDPSARRASGDLCELFELTQSAARRIDPSAVQDGAR